MLLLGPPAGAVAQGFTVRGRVLEIRGHDSLPLGGIWAVLHHVTTAGGAPVDSGPTDGAGWYRLRAPVRDTAAVYFVSARYRSIAYLTLPLRATRQRIDSVGVLLVYDTSSTSPPIELAQRHLVIRHAESDGSRRVLELMVLRNGGTNTRIAADTSQPVWTGRLPEGVLQFQVGESDVSAETVIRRGDSVVVVAPLPPGEKQLVLTYLLPGNASQVALPTDQSIGQLNVMVEDSAASVAGGPVVAMGAESFEGATFLRFEGRDVPGGTPVLLRFGRVPWSARNLWWIVVALSALALVGALVVWWRRADQVSPAGADDVEALAARIAALDASQETRRDPGYAARRAELKRRLEAALAGATRRP